MKRKNPVRLLTDVLLATVFTYVIILALKLVFFNTQFLNPISNALEDFQFTDLYYSSIRPKANTVVDDIILVNIAEDRKGIAEQLAIISAAQPKVIGLDVNFPVLKDSLIDERLKREFQGDIPLVLASQINYENNKAGLDKTHPYFGVSNREAYGNFLAEEGTTVRYFKPFLPMEGDEEYPSFAAKIARIYDQESFKNLQQRNNKTEIIHYTNANFITLDNYEIYEGNEQLKILEGKIVLMGYMGPTLGVRVLEDLHLTPVNKSYGGHSVPDTYGVEIHGNILNMILNDSYINEPPKAVVWVLSFLITFAHMLLFVYYFVKRHIWFHIVAKFIQLTSFVLLLIASILIYHYFNLKLEPALLMLAVILSVDALYFYDGIVQWLHKKYGVNSYFLSGH